MKTTQLLVQLTRLFNKAFKIGFLHLLSANLLLQVAGFSGQIFLTRILSVDDIGRVKVLQSFISILIIIAGLGLNVSILKLCSEQIGQKKKINLFAQTLKITLIFSVLVIVFVEIIAFWGWFSADSKINDLMSIYALQIPFLVLGAFFASYLQSQKKIHLMSNVQSISKIFVVFISVVSAYYLGINGYVISLAISLSITTLLFIPLLKLELRSIKSAKISLSTIKFPLKMGGYSFVTNLLGQLILALNIIILNYVGDHKTELGYYAIAHLITTSIMIIPNTLNQLMIPYISKQTGNLIEIKSLLKKFELRLKLLTLFIVVGSFFIIPIILPMIFGDIYVNAIVYFRVLIIGIVFWSIYSPKAITLVSIGRVDTNFKVSVLSFIINLMLNIILILNFGVLGAAIATTLTYFITIFINSYFFNKVFNKW